MLYFVSGGVRSGKSFFAEKLVCDIEILNKVYIATAKSTGIEMKERIERHKYDRKEKGFKTIECDSNLKYCTYKLKKEDTVLLECLTTLVANEMFDNNLLVDECVDKIVNDIVEINRVVNNLIVVSNCVYGESFNYCKSVENYKKVVANVSNELVKASDEVYEVIYSKAIRRK